MAKRKPDQVIRHEIVLGRSDRELIETAIIARNANTFLSTAVKALSDVSFLVFLGSALVAYGIITSEKWREIKDAALSLGGSAEDTAAAIIGGLADVLEIGQREYGEWEEEGTTRYLLGELWNLLRPETIAGIPIFGGAYTAPPTYGGVTSEDRAEAGY